MRTPLISLNGPLMQPYCRRDKTPRKTKAGNPPGGEAEPSCLAELKLRAKQRLTTLLRRVERMLSLVSIRRIASFSLAQDFDPARLDFNLTLKIRTSATTSIVLVSENLVLPSVQDHGPWHK
jgi:hypothetical protein